MLICLKLTGVLALSLVSFWYFRAMISVESQSYFQRRDPVIQVEQETDETSMEISAAAALNNRRHSWQDCAHFRCHFRYLNGTIAPNLSASSTSQVSESCNNILFQMLSELETILKKHAIIHYVTFGTLLGAVQSFDIFGWTSDVDLAIPSHLLSQLLSNQTILDDLHASGLISIPGGSRLVRVCLAEGWFDGTSPERLPELLVSNREKNSVRRQMEFYEKYVYVDLYSEFRPRKLELKVNPSECSFRNGDIYPLQSCLIRNKKFPCPRRTEFFLRTHYGPQFSVLRDQVPPDLISTFGCLPNPCESGKLSLPLLMLNVGGEMLYIIRERLRVHDIAAETQLAILRGLVGELLDEKFLKDLAQKQDLFSFVSVKRVLEKIILTTVLRLDQSSIDKLFDLAVMAFKYQICSCIHPQELLSLTCNHLDEMYGMCGKPKTLDARFNNAHIAVLDIYRGMTIWELYHVKQSLMAYLQPKTTRVSLFVTKNIQNMDATFNFTAKKLLPPRTNKPGQIRYFTSDGKIARTDTFQVPTGLVDRTVSADSYLSTVPGMRNSPLGLDLFQQWGGQNTSGIPDKIVSKDTRPTLKVKPSDATTLKAVMGSSSVSINSVPVKIFLDSPEEPDASKQPSAFVQEDKKVTTTTSGSVNITTQSSRLSFAVAPQSDDPDDLLGMMDASS